MPNQDVDQDTDQSPDQSTDQNLGEKATLQEEASLEERKERSRKHVFGRRQGHPLHAHHLSLMENLLPKVTVPPLDDVAPASLDPKSFFAKGEALQPVSQVWLEIGFGGGEHLAHQAEQNPSVGIIGCEPFINGVAKLLNEIEDRALTNVCVQADDARPVLASLETASVHKCFLLYPDPWHKKRHKKRRFVSPANLDQLARILAPGALMRVASDIPDYCEWTLEHMQAHPAFQLMPHSAADCRTPPADWLSTRYEAKALREGRTPSYFDFERL